MHTPGTASAPSVQHQYHQSSTTTDLNNSNNSNSIINNSKMYYSPFQAYQNHIAATKYQQQKIDDDNNAAQDTSLYILHKNREAPAPESGSRLIADNSVSSSPYQQRRVASESRWRSPSASPLPLRSHQFQSNEPDQQYNCGNTSPIILQRFYHQQKQQQLAKEADESGKFSI